MRINLIKRISIEKFSIYFPKYKVYGYDLEDPMSYLYFKQCCTS